MRRATEMYSKACLWNARTRSASPPGTGAGGDAEAGAAPELLLAAMRAREKRWQSHTNDSTCESKTGQSAPCPAESLTPTQMVRGWGADRERSEQQDTASPPVCAGVRVCALPRVPPGAHGGREGRARREPRGWGRPPRLWPLLTGSTGEKRGRPPSALGGAASRPGTMLPGAAPQGARPSLAGQGPAPGC